MRTGSLSSDRWARPDGAHRRISDCQNGEMELTAVRLIARSAADVFTFISDAANNPKWQQGMQSCRWTSGPPIVVGSAYEQEARFLGRTVRTTFAVTELEPATSMTISSTSGSFPITVRRWVEAVGPMSTEVHAQIQGDPGRFFRLAAPLVRRLAQRSVDRDYDRLVEVLSDS